MIEDNRKTTTILTIANCKGGVAKTTSAAAIGGGLSLRGFEVLLVDFDCQGNLTNYFLNKVPDTVASDIFTNRKIPIIPVQEHLDIVPTDDMLNVIDHNLTSADDKYIFQKVLKKISGRYDFIVVDCPPALNWITLNAFVASDFIFVPMRADRDSLNGLNQIASYCYQASNKTTISGIFFTSFESNLNLTKKIVVQTRQNFADILMKTRVRKCSKVGEARNERRILQEYDRSCNAAIDYENLIDEILVMAKTDGSKTA